MTKYILTSLLALSFSSAAWGFQVFNQTTSCVYVKEYAHVFNRYNQHINRFSTGSCSESSSRCIGQLDFQVVKHTDGSDLQVEDTLCAWQGDVGDSLGYFLISPNPAVKPGEKNSCVITYIPQK